MGANVWRSLAKIGLGVSIALFGLPMLHASAGTTVVNVRDAGAKGDGVTDDSVAIQKAETKIASSGGTLFFPNGTYLVAGLFLDSNVTMTGDAGAILKHPNGYNPAEMIRARKFATTGTIVKGLKKMHVADATHARVGGLVAIRGAGEKIVGQTTNTPYLYARVSQIASNGDITIDRPALGSVTNQDVYFGSQNIAIKGLTFDGNRPADQNAGHSVFVMNFGLVRGITVSGCSISRGLNGAIELDLGTAEGVIENNAMTDNGARDVHLGVTIGLFRGAHHNAVRNNTIGGALTYKGIWMDDRTQNATDWDASSDWNTIENNTIDFPTTTQTLGISVLGSNWNTLRSNTIAHMQTGISVDDSEQGNNGRTSRHNTVDGNSLNDHYIGIHVSGSNNAFDQNAIGKATRTIVNTGEDNTFN